MLLFKRIKVASPWKMQSIENKRKWSGRNDKQVIEKFLNKQAGKTPERMIYGSVYVYRGRTLNSTGIELYNYQTVIAYWMDDILYLNTKKYSVTTSKIQNTLRDLASQAGIKTIEYKAGE